jgi:DNA polymerase II large subunit
MDSKEYFDILTKNYEKAFAVASAARSRGYDPEVFVEIKAAPDLASRVEGIIGLDGLADMIRSKMKEKSLSRQELAFEIVKAICTDNRYNEKYAYDVKGRLTLAVRSGLAILTEGVLVAPTEGLQGVNLYRNADGSDYIAVIYAGPIRGAGGTSAALSVALADYARKLLMIGQYRATGSEVERTIEEMLLYHARCARLQYLPSEGDMRKILENCPVCIDGLPTEDIEVSVHRNIKRLDSNGKEEQITNRVRGGIGLVVCEGIAQKAKSVLKYTKMAGLDWSWLNEVIKADKGTVQKSGKEDKKIAVFLQELVAGRPVLAYPGYHGSFRLRYGRSRLTGIAAKGFSPATMWLLGEFIAVGTQLKVEKPGKGCVAMPVDSIEGPFVKLSNGEALRVNSVEEAKAVAHSITKILSVGDILVTYGDFKKTNTPLQPTSYVEEYWEEQLRAAGFKGEMPKKPDFREAYGLSKAYNVPMHPLYIYDYNEISQQEILAIAKAVLSAKLESKGDSLFDLAEIEFKTDRQLTQSIERLCIPHLDRGDTIAIRNNDAQSLIASLGFSSDSKIERNQATIDKYNMQLQPVEMLNSFSPFTIMVRATRIGARIGRPEKAKERLMKPAPNVLFPIFEYGSKERNISRAYSDDKRKFGLQLIDVEMVRAKCDVGGEFITTMYCFTHKSRASIDRVCSVCGRSSKLPVCSVCKGKTIGSDRRKINLASMIDSAMATIGVQSMPKVVKGVKGLVSRDKLTEPLEKGILRSQHSISIFKDGTARFDATDAPMTHFYPKEIGVGIAKLRELGYTEDFRGAPLERDDQLLELKHQDVVLNRNGMEYMYRISGFVDELLVRFYGLEPFYNLHRPEDLAGHCVITLSPHTSCGVLGRIIGFTNASVGFAHPYTISARRRNCDGDEDTTMLLLDGLVNFSRSYLPVTIGGTMDAPLIMSIHILPEEVDDEVHAMEIVERYGKEFYDKTYSYPSPGDVSIELVGNRLGKQNEYIGLNFTHLDSPDNITGAPMRSMYTKLKTMQEKLDAQFSLMDKLCTVDRQDTARRLIMSHFIPDLMGNLHSFSRQTFRCVNCNAKYRRIPLIGKCKKCKGKIVLTISKGGIEKYMNIALDLTEKYELEEYMKQRLLLLKDEIETVFGGVGGGNRSVRQFNLSNYL